MEISLSFYVYNLVYYLKMSNFEKILFQKLFLTQVFKWHNILHFYSFLLILNIYKTRP